MTDINDLIQVAVKSQDFTQESAGGNFKRELPEAGVGLCRFREYVEIGLQEAKSTKYPNKKPVRKARFVFELTTPKHIFEYVVDGVKKKRPHILTVMCPISASDRSNYIKLFRKLNWKGDITHPAQALGRPFMCEITHAWAKGDDPKTTPPKYANLSKDGEFMLSPARNVDPLAGTTTDINVPELMEPVRIFLWDNPTQETWDALFIDGTREKDGKEVSNNWIQNMLKEAVDYDGSALYALLEGMYSTAMTDEPPVFGAQDEIPF